jgi:hypothetical protein
MTTAQSVVGAPGDAAVQPVRVAMMLIIAAGCGMVTGLFLALGRVERRAILPGGQP